MWCPSIATLAMYSDDIQLAGPMWSGPIHDSTFVEKVLNHIEGKESAYGTHARMKGMLTIAKEVCLSIGMVL